MTVRFLQHLAVAVGFIVGSAAAEAAGIGDFAGQWVGKVTVETLGPTDFPTSVRDSGVTLTPDDKGGFTLEWSTAKRETGDPEDPTEKVADTQVVFVKDEAANRWHAEGGDPAKGQPLWYARLDEETLIVTGFARLEEGQAQLQTWRRTLEGESLGLSYTRVLDGVLTRRASGALTRFAP
ncbi:hypothetical protein sos41_16990 [Alphaproteobacteria bacterium SO-S41]|nr:hypothetical protein sos41_16990 [Alphaproteobacteria bacterium SO-S41]